MRVILLICGLLLALVALAAEAGIKAGPNMAGPGHHRLKVPSAAAPPLDGLTTPTGAYSFRKLRTAYAGNAVRLRRASDNAELDIGFLGFVPGLGAPWDEAAAAGHCNATPCFGRFWYDQSGAARDLGQTTAANQPQLIFNCNGTLPCFRTTTSTHTLTGPSVTPATGLVTISAVGNRTSGGACIWLRENGNANRLATAGGANLWQIQPGGFSVTAADGAWHAAVAVLSPAAGQSVINLDGTETTGTSVPTTAAAAVGVFGGATTICNHGEAIFWDNVTLTPAERSVLVANQRSFWGF